VSNGVDSVKNTVDSHKSNAKDIDRAAFYIMPKINGDIDDKDKDDEDWV